MLNLGEYNQLEILRKTSVGLYLGDGEGNDILLPNKYCPEEYKIGDQIEVFVYKDHEQRWIATSLHPFVTINKFAYLRVKSISPIGAFLDWGLEKDLFVPFREQGVKMERGQFYVVYLYQDVQTQRLVASGKVNKFLHNNQLDIPAGSLVDLIVFETTPLGYNVIINHKFKGLIYHNEIFKKIQIGDTLQGYIKLIREDGGIDISLQAKGVKRLESGAQQILDYLSRHRGKLNLTDKSTPEDILQTLQMSKKNFKQSIGILYKQRLIEIGTEGITLL